MKLKKYINIGSGDSIKERKDEKKMDCVDDMCIY